MGESWFLFLRVDELMTRYIETSQAIGDVEVDESNVTIDKLVEFVGITKATPTKTWKSVVGMQILKAHIVANNVVYVLNGWFCAEITSRSEQSMHIGVRISMFSQLHGLGQLTNSSSG